MSDPNATYKAAFRDLQIKLGRLPTAAEILPLNIAYARSWAPAEETVLPPNAAAGRRAPEGFSRKPAPQASAIDTSTRTREDQEALYASHLASQEATGAPDKSAKGAGRRSAPEPAANKPGAAQGLILGSRGPGGGLILRCHQCGQLWERGKVRGRPSFKCEECR